MGSYRVVIHEGQGRYFPQIVTDEVQKRGSMEIVFDHPDVQMPIAQDICTAAIQYTGQSEGLLKQIQKILGEECQEKPRSQAER